jgi:nicotinamidase-related amidase
MTTETLPSLLIPARHHAFPIVLSQTALLVIDMQYDFCDRRGFCSDSLDSDVTPVQAIVPKIQTVIHWARHHQIPVIYTRESHASDLSDVSPSKQLRYANAGYPVGAVGKMGRFLIRGEAGTAILDELKPLNSDVQLDKPAQSAFIGTDLEAILRQRGVTHLVFTGVTTECCVLGTYRQASDLGFYCLLLEDCCAAFSQTEHQAAIEVLLGEKGAIGWVTSSDALLTHSAIPD